jgi:hypothetical protein
MAFARIGELYRKVKELVKPQEPPLPESEEKREILAHRVLKTAIFHDLGHMKGKRISPERLEEILLKAARREKVSHRYEILRSYIFDFAEKTYCWEYDPQSRKYIIR